MRKGIAVERGEETGRGRQKGRGGGGMQERGKDHTGAGKERTRVRGGKKQKRTKRKGTSLFFARELETAGQGTAGKSMVVRVRDNLRSCGSSNFSPRCWRQAPGRRSVFINPMNASTNTIWEKNFA